MVLSAGSVGWSFGEYQNGRRSTANLGIELTTVPDWIPRRFFGVGQVLYLEPPAFFRYRFTSPDNAFWYSNWHGVNVDKVLILDPPESGGWTDDIELVLEPGVVGNWVVVQPWS